MLLTAAQLAAELGCSERTVSDYVRAGMPSTGRPRTFDIALSRAWIRRHIDPGKTHGGKRPQAGRKGKPENRTQGQSKPELRKQGTRKQGGRKPDTESRAESAPETGRRQRPGLEIQEPIDFDAAKAKAAEAGGGGGVGGVGGGGGDWDSIPTNVEELTRLAESGKLTRTSIGMATEAIKLRKAMREEDEEAGKLVSVQLVETAWTRGVQALRAGLEQLPAAIAARAQAGLSLTSPQVTELRRLLGEQCAAAMRNLVEACREAMAPE